jgi:photosystem II stability/assembly factor-like uncharacterized protein
LNPTVNMTDITSPNGTHIFASAPDGTILTSTDSGANWTRRFLNTPDVFYGISGASTTAVYAVGNAESIHKSTDGSGAAWSRVNGGPGTVSGISFAGQQGIISTSYGGIWSTANGGTAWTSRTSGTTETLWEVARFSPTNAVAVGNAGTVITSTDGGATWAAQTSGVPTQSLRDVDAGNEVTAWAVGTNGTILKTTNGGTTWNTQTSPTANMLTGVVAVDKNTAFAVGRGGVVIKTTDGSTWVSATSTSAFDLWAVDAVDSQLVYVTGQNGDVMKSTNAGASWTDIYGGSWWENFYSISAPYPGVVYLGERHGGMLRTVDDGTTWGSVLSGTWLEGCGCALEATGPNEVYSGGGFTIVAKTDPGLAIADYGGTQTWADPADTFFGACLRTLTGGGNLPVWATDVNCPKSDGAFWKPVPATFGAASKVASKTTIGGGDVTANLRFGFKAAGTLNAGTYRATMVIDVLAPDA